MTRADYEYYEWLVSQITIPNNKTYLELFERMHNFEFIWIVPNDDNRIQDGFDLRSEFFNGSRQRLINKKASFLEVLIGLSRHVAFTGGGNSGVWAWKLIKNLRLNRMSDPLIGEQIAKVDDILDTVIWRTYSKSGQGGFFPLKQNPSDQTKIEIWYQMNAYINEMREL